jgi:hypothetical protein
MSLVMPIKEPKFGGLRALCRYIPKFNILSEFLHSLNGKEFKNILYMLRKGVLDSEKSYQSLFF